MVKECIYCPAEYEVPNNGHTQGKYGVCPECEAKGVSTAKGWERAVIELQALLISKDPRR